MSGKKNSQFPQPAAEVLLDIRSLLQFHRQMGIAAYPRSAALRHFLTLPEAKRQEGSPQGRGKTKRRQQTAGPPNSDAGHGFRELSGEIAACGRCDLAELRLGTVAGRGRIDCALMVVGDWSLQAEGFSGQVMFGPAEDEMLRRMVTAIDLQPDDVYVTNCVKCATGRETQPDLNSAEQCFSYLAREIASVRPRVICAMGELAARVLCGGSEPLARLRGRFCVYRCEPSSEVAVMPTFHPRFLLQYPEMKKATWQDLLAVKEKIDTGKG